MRTINEQELKDILDRHGKWLRKEEGGERANLSYANLSYANLRSANLRSANLYSADLHSANLRYANLRSADLRSANLYSADLHSVDLSSANLSSTNLSSTNLSYANLLIFQFRRHWAYFTLDGTLRIGCIIMPISEWLVGFEEIGRSNGYAPYEIVAYGNFIKSCAEIFELENQVPKDSR